MNILKMKNNFKNEVWGFDKPISERNIMILWKFTYWCNYNCSYCFQKDHSLYRRLNKINLKNPLSLFNFLRKAKYGHSFQNYNIKTWLDAFKKIGNTRKISLHILGGEPFLDQNNFYLLLKGLTEMDCIDNIRIDTNGSWKPELYKKIDFSKIYLNVSFHPEQISLKDFFKKIISFQNYNIKISMINYVMAPNQIKDYENVRDKFKKIGIKVNPNVFMNGILPKSINEVKIYQKYLNPFDIKYKCGLEKSKNKLCRLPLIGLYIDPDAKVHNICFSKKRINFIKAKKEKIESLLFEKYTKCPKDYCICIDRHSFLLESKRNLCILNPLKQYVKKGILI